MKKIFFAVILFSFISTSTVFCWEDEEADKSGNIIVYDPKGHIQWGHVGSGGNMIIHDPKGDTKWGHVDRNGNIIMQDKKGSIKRGYMKK
ncbi:MAG TPA: hypothetical protein VMW81_03170 [Nitrospinota bacterium]|nr:hypothetical protein [Nitrospinota bacterium]